MQKKKEKRKDTNVTSLKNIYLIEEGVNKQPTILTGTFQKAHHLANQPFRKQ